MSEPTVIDADDEPLVQELLARGYTVEHLRDATREMFSITTGDTNPNSNQSFIARSPHDIRTLHRKMPILARAAQHRRHATAARSPARVSDDVAYVLAQAAAEQARRHA